MTVLAADLARTFETGPINTLPVAASAVIYKGSAVGDSSGYARALVAGDKFRGFADARADNRGGEEAVAGAKKVDVITEGWQEVTLTGVALTDEGKPVYMSDDNTFTLTATSNSLVGYIHRYVGANKCTIKFGTKVELGVDLPASTAATSTTPFGFTEAQANSILALCRTVGAWFNGK